VKNIINRILNMLGERWTDGGSRHRVQRFLLLALGSVVIFCLLFVGAVWTGIFGPIPDEDELRNVDHQLATEVYSADSVLLGKYFLEDRSKIPASEIPEFLKEALISTEDIRFYSHDGVDARSLVRVVIKGILLQRESAGGGSTLTQQLAKNLYPRRSYLLFSLPINKMREVLIARRLEDVYTKDKILALYLNTIPFGDNAFGIKSAAERFYGVRVGELTLDQAAVLVGMLKATYRYNPRLFPERAHQRRNVVLSQMSKYGFITDSTRQVLAEKPIELQYRTVSQNAGLAPYFRTYLKQELQLWCRSHRKPDGTSYSLYTDGLKVYTTIDSRLQRYAEDAMQGQMKKLQRAFARQVNEKALRGVAMAKAKQLPLYKQLKDEGYSDDEVMANLKEPGPRSVFSWEGEGEKVISTYDSVVHHVQFLQAGLLAKDPQTGAIRVWVGGIDHRFFQYDHVRESTKRQVGSTFKPIVYAAAMEKGVRPCDYTSARRTSYANLDDWAPQNTATESYDKKYSMEGGLAASVNTVSVKLMEKTGIHNVIDMAGEMGINTRLPAVPSLALGTASISVSEMVGAYGVFANDGSYVPSFSITSITDARGAVLESFTNEDDVVEALSPDNAKMMLYMLKRVVNEGTGSGLRSRYGLRNDMAGKTGTTQANADGWFIGIIPNLVIGCWVGADEPALHFQTSAGQGAATALPIVAQFLQKVNEDPAFRSLSDARFSTLTPELLAKLDCDLSRSDRNLLQRIFNIKRGTKESRFKDSRQRN
jgi:penicillin-binding protein 1A